MEDEGERGMCRGSQEGRMTAGLRAPTPAPRHFSGPLRSLRRVLSTVVPRGPKARGWQVADAHLRPQGQRLRFGSRRRALISLNDPRSQQEEPAKMGLLGMAKEPQLATSIGAAKRGSARLSLLTRERALLLPVTGRCGGWLRARQPPERRATSDLRGAGHADALLRQVRPSAR